MKAKELKIEKWLNVNEVFELNVESRKIKVIHVFQMLCPGCVYRGIPQTIELFNKFNGTEVAVVGLHSVFENHHVMTAEALEVFIHEWRLPFPVGIDLRLEGQWMPETMRTYQLQGTPSLIIIDHLGEVKLSAFGHLDLDRVESLISSLIIKMKTSV
ncbi:peroxiredoxin [Bacteriovorax sp. Seq25_V]|uniref:peroxiredoxin family protein n=1 Tax=Bacteriovorax sp. Seq25_V TaxID=1201288 RepID=UPI000389E0A5|nr:hypothetical protein [Bacteriovorax sp. Seq25_V]EQC45518.1 hypothetical protein M900_1956 [Bacteriovorax sp. Seq25_V]